MKLWYKYMVRKSTTFLLVLLILIPTLLAFEVTPPQLKNPVNKIKADTNKPTTNIWNETVIISPVWQTLIGGFFGLNIHNESTEISVREALVFFSVFIIFFVVMLDIMKLMPFFKTKILGIFSEEFLAALIITTIVSITGVFINLKNVFMNIVPYTINKLDWGWLHYAIEHQWLGTFLTILVLAIILFVYKYLLWWLQPFIKKYSQVSRAEAAGRLLRTSAIEKSDI